MERVCVFLDWQNVYKRARESFFDGPVSHNKGQVDPLELGEVLASKGLNPRSLIQVRVYRGMPDQGFDAKAYAAYRRQVSRWTNQRIEVISRKIRYPTGWTPTGTVTAPAREKGVDVALAVDLVTMASEDVFDTAVVMSSDHDIEPAIEWVKAKSLKGGPRVEVAAWSGDYGRRSNRIASRSGIFCHWLDASDYWGVEDDTDYAVASVPPSTSSFPVPKPPSRWTN